MARPEIGDINYCIFDPTGNITALVETVVDPAYQPALASRIMERHPEVEQVGFVTFNDGEACANPEENKDLDVKVSLRMAGGEFCGNATMCAAALYAIRSGLQSGAVAVKVSGASAPLTVSLERQAAGSFSAAVLMPPALRIGMMELAPAVTERRPDSTGAAGASCAGEAAGAQETAAAGGLEDVGAAGVSAKLSLPLVEMEGISHIIVEPDSGFFGLKEDSAAAETLLRQWCSALGSDCLGMMFLGGPRIGCERALVPLVYVPGADTMFWENSCASGSVAAGIYLAAKAEAPVDITFDEPAGSLRVESDPASGKTVLHGSVILCH